MRTKAEVHAKLTQLIVEVQKPDIPDLAFTILVRQIQMVHWVLQPTGTPEPPMESVSAAPAPNSVKLARKSLDK